MEKDDRSGKVVTWPTDQGPYQPDPKSFKGVVSEGGLHVEITGITPMSQDPQTQPATGKG